MHPKHFEKKIKRSRHDEYTELSDQREDGDENLVAYSAGNSLGSEYLNHL
jgi:paired amphipathic helix protein Sin3a